MSQPFDTHSYPVIPTTEATNSGAQFGSASQQSQDFSSQPQFSTSQHTPGHSSTGGSSAQGATNNPGQTAANVTNKIVDSMVCRHSTVPIYKLCLLTILVVLKFYFAQKLHFSWQKTNLTLVSSTAYNAAANHPAVQSIANGMSQS